MRAFRHRQTESFMLLRSITLTVAITHRRFTPLCSVPAVAFYGMELLSSVPLAEITCGRCRRMDEFKDLLRKGRVG
jgi:hypothetical protein